MYNPQQSIFLPSPSGCLVHLKGTAVLVEWLYRTSLIQWGLDYRTRSEFKWSKVVWIWNNSDIEWFGQNGGHFVQILNSSVLEQSGP